VIEETGNIDLNTGNAEAVKTGPGARKEVFLKS